MFDQRALRLITPAVNTLARQLVRLGISATQVTLAAFLLGIFASYLIATQAYFMGTFFIFVSRLLDALDGAVARLTQSTDAGGFLDISLDFLFYASVPLAYALADPLQNALPAAVLLAAFVGTASSFLAFAILAAKRGLASTVYPQKSFYFLGGLTEATETLVCFSLMGVWPHYFPEFAYVFALMCCVTIAMRIGFGWRTLQAPTPPPATKA